MDAIEEIRKKLQKHPDLQVIEEDLGLSVTPENGFCVSIHSNGEYYSVGLEGWHEDFDSPEEAMNCFAWGLSKDCRLKIICRGGKAHKWVAQYNQEGKWLDSSTTGLIFFPFWRSATISYAQNNVIDS